ncbi:MAG: HD domain-containing protein [Candidatus Omnitrophica bacterium]|nr:HD domain-containing protein [Candidatus Omnitrophota bacterium]
MVRLADLIKQKMEEARKAGEYPDKPQEKLKNKAELAKAICEINKAKSEESCAYYEDVRKLIKEAFFQLSKDSNFELASIKDIVSKVVDQLVIDGSKLLKLAISKPAPEDYIICHSVNVCIFSIEIGLSMKYNKSDLNTIGLGALLHDIGLAKMTSIFLTDPTKLSSTDVNLLKSHPLVGFEIAGKYVDIAEDAKKIIAQHHERYNGSGYPQALKGDAISKFSQIVGLANLFESKTHPRPGRKKMVPYEFMKELFTHEENLFATDIIKAMVKRFGIYPISSWVMLNSNQICQVCDVNENFPLRPIVNVLFDAEGKRLSQPKILNLAEQKSGVHIKEAFGETDLIIGEKDIKKREVR